MYLLFSCRSSLFLVSLTTIVGVFRRVSQEGGRILRGGVCGEQSPGAHTVGDVSNDGRYVVRRSWTIWRGYEVSDLKVTLLRLPQERVLYV